MGLTVEKNSAKASHRHSNPSSMQDVCHMNLV